MLKLLVDRFASLVQSLITQVSRDDPAIRTTQVPLSVICRVYVFIIADRITSGTRSLSLRSDLSSLVCCAVRRNLLTFKMEIKMVYNSHTALPILRNKYQQWGKKSISDVVYRVMG